MVEPIADTIMTFVTSYLSDAAPMIMLFYENKLLVAVAFFLKLSSMSILG